jgi:hypothetical protein
MITGGAIGLAHESGPDVLDRIHFPSDTMHTGSTQVN